MLWSDLLVWSSDGALWSDLERLDRENQVAMVLDPWM